MEGKKEKNQEEVEEDFDDPTVVITLADDDTVHEILGLPGTANLPPQINIPPLQQQATAAASKQNLIQWLDAVFDHASSGGKKSRNLRGQIIPGSYDGLRGHEYGKMESMLSNVLPLVRDMMAYIPPGGGPIGISAGQMRVFWGGASSSIIKIGLFMDD